ncbi:MAG: hypothetical protein AB4058_14650 [Microcystaceae cyanobacterium]
MNPLVFGIIGLLIGALPSAYFFMQLSPLQGKLKLAEKGKERSEKAYDEAQAELQTKTEEIEAAKSKIPELEAHYRSEIENLEQSHQTQITELQQAQAQLPQLEAQIEDMKASQVRVMELETEMAALQASQSAAPTSQITEEQLQALQQEHQAEIQQLQQDSQGQIQALQEQHRAELEELLETSQTQVQEAEQKYLGELQTYQAQLQENEQKYQAELKNVESTYQQQILLLEQDFEERLAGSDASEHEPRANQTIEHEPPSIEPVVALVDPQPALEQLEANDVVADLTAPDSTESSSLLEENPANLDEVFAISEDSSFEELAVVEQESSVEDDIAGLEEFLGDTAEDADPDLELTLDESPIAEETEEALTGLNALLEETNETEDTDASEIPAIPTLEGEQTLSVAEDIANLDAFLSETADLAIDEEQEDSILEPLSDNENSPDELEFLATLQTDSAPALSDKVEDDQADSLPDLADLSAPDDDFFSMMQEDAPLDDDVPSSPSLSDEDNPFADIFADEPEKKKDSHPENGRTQQDAFDELLNMDMDKT